MMITKVAKVGCKITEVALRDNATAGEALNAAGIVKGSDETLYVNHIVSDSTKTLCVGDTVIVEKTKVPALPEVSQKMADFIDFLIEEEIFDEIYTEDEDREETDEIDYSAMYEDNKYLLDSMIEKAKEIN